MQNNMALIGIDPKTKVCMIVGISNMDTALEIWREKLILVELPREKAKAIWNETVPDIYALVAG